MDVFNFTKRTRWSSGSFRSDDVFSAWELRKYKNIIQRVLENFNNKFWITIRGSYNEFLPINIEGGG